MPQIIADPFAEIQTNTAGLFVGTTVITGVSVLKDTRQILRSNTDTGITEEASFHSPV